MKRFGKKGKTPEGESPPPPNPAEQAAAEEINEWTGRASTSFGAPPPSYAPPPAYSPPPAQGPPVDAPSDFPGAGRAPLGYPAAGAPPATGGFPGPVGPPIGGFPGAGGIDEPTSFGGREEEAVTEMALMDFAQRSGLKPEDTALRIDRNQAESMRDQALREYMMKQAERSRGAEADNIETQAERARLRFARARGEIPEEEEESLDVQAERARERFARLRGEEVDEPPRSRFQLIDEDDDAPPQGSLRSRFQEIEDEPEPPVRSKFQQIDDDDEPAPSGPLADFAAVAGRLSVPESFGPIKPRGRAKPAAKKASPKKKSPAKTSTVKKKAPAKKAPAKKKPATKKSTARSAPARKKAPGKKTPAKKSPAKKKTSAKKTRR